MKHTQFHAVGHERRTLLNSKNDEGKKGRGAGRDQTEASVCPTRSNYTSVCNRSTSARWFTQFSTAVGLLSIYNLLLSRYPNIALWASYPWRQGERCNTISIDVRDRSIKHVNQTCEHPTRESVLISVVQDLNQMIYKSWFKSLSVTYDLDLNHFISSDLWSWFKSF